MFDRLSQASWCRIGAAVMLAGSLSANAAFAAGKHSGGHGDEDDHGHGAMAFGEKGEPAEVDRTIEIVATDNKYDVETVDVEVGETVRFVIENKGQLLHEFNIGTAEMHAEHQKEMLEMMQTGMMTPTGMKEMMGESHDNGGMTHGGMTHDDPNSVLIEPGETRELIWKFTKAEKLEFACNVPGHYESGMHGQFHVE